MPYVLTRWNLLDINTTTNQSFEDFKQTQKCSNTLNKKYSTMYPDGPLSTVPELDLGAVN